MAKYVAFLRGMNLGRRRVKNDELRVAFEALDLTDVATFLASGNVVFATPASEVEALAERIATGLEGALGYPVPTFLRTAAEARAIAALEPFPGAVGGKLQVALLTARPSRSAKAEVESFSTDEDRLALHGRELYWQPGGNLTDSALDLRGVEALLGSMTIRTKRTIDRLAAKFLAS